MITQWHKSVGTVPGGEIGCGGACFTITDLTRFFLGFLAHSKMWDFFPRPLIYHIYMTHMVGQELVTTCAPQAMVSERCNMPQSRSLSNVSSSLIHVLCSMFFVRQAVVLVLVLDQYFGTTLTCLSHISVPCEWGIIKISTFFVGHHGTKAPSWHHGTINHHSWYHHGIIMVPWHHNWTVISVDLIMTRLRMTSAIVEKNLP